MTQTQMYDLISKLLDCSVYMKEIDMEVSNSLLNLADSLLPSLSKSTLSSEVKEEIESIKSEILDD